MSSQAIQPGQDDAAHLGPGSAPSGDTAPVQSGPPVLPGLTLNIVEDEEPPHFLPVAGPTAPLPIPVVATASISSTPSRLDTAPMPVQMPAPMAVPGIVAEARSCPPEEARVEAQAQAGDRRWRRPLLYGGMALLGAGMLAAQWVIAEPPQKQSAALRTEEQLLHSLAAAEQSRNWGLLHQRAEHLLGMAEASRETRDKARQARDRASAEEHNLLIYDRFLDAVTRRAFDAAVLTFAELSEGSVYREMGAPRYVEMRKGFIKNHLDRARSLSKARGCREAQPHLDAILAIDPQSALQPEVQALSARCGGGPGKEPAPEPGPGDQQKDPPDAPGFPAGPAAEDDTQQASSAPSPRSRVAGPEPRRPAPGRDASKAGKEQPSLPAGRRLASRAQSLPTAPEPEARPETKNETEAANVPAPRDVRPGVPLEAAQRAYISGNYRQAIRIAKNHTESDPERAWRVIGGAACYLGDSALVRETLDHLDDPAQRFVRQICQRNGLSL